MSKAKIVKGVKAFNKGLKCRGFQFEEGKEYTHEGPAQICNQGFHFCENPLDVLNHYDLIDSEFATVEAIGDVDKEKGGSDSKVATNKIKIGVKLDLPMFVKASIDFLLDNTKLLDGKTVKSVSKDEAQLASSGDYAQLASSGHYAKLASSGHYAKLASSGHSAQLASSGHSAQLASSGDSAKLASSGHYAKLASSGHYAKLASSGDYAQLASSGDYAKLASSGHYAKLASSGHSAQLASSGDYAKLAVNKHSIAAGIGHQNYAKGSIGSWLVLAEWDYNGGVWTPKDVQVAKVDGKTIKEDTYYQLSGGKFIEA